MGDAKINIGICVLYGVDGGPLDLVLIRHRGAPVVVQVGPLGAYSHWEAIKAAADYGQQGFDAECSACFGVGYSALPSAEKAACKTAVVNR